MTLMPRTITPTPVAAVSQPRFLFAADTAPLRRDPRFVGVVERLGSPTTGGKPAPGRIFATVNRHPSARQFGDQREGFGKQARQRVNGLQGREAVIQIAEWGRASVTGSRPKLKFAQPALLYLGVKIGVVLRTHVRASWIA
jgi:hypothetical protein